MTVRDFLEAHRFRDENLDREELISAFDAEIEAKLAGRASSLALLSSCLSADGSVRTDEPALVVDAGGTNLRVAAVTLPSDGSAPRFEHVVRRPMPGTYGELDADAFHRAIADVVSEVAAKVPSASRLGYCFSYAFESTPDHDARLLAWAKNVAAPEVVGQLVGSELLKRTTAAVGRSVVLNDTVATLLAGKSRSCGRRFGGHLGFILGTGTNTACVERGEILNAESGEFNKLERSDFDLVHDSATVDPGKAVFEKMISGAYLGGVGLTMLRAASEEGLFSSTAAAAVASLRELTTVQLDGFVSNPLAESNPLSAVFALESDRVLARELARAVFHRAAVLTAVHLAAFVRRCPSASRATPVLIAIDGSTYYKTTAVPFDAIVRDELDRLAAVGGLYEIVRVEEAPMAGAAVAALTDADGMPGRDFTTP